MEGSLQKRGIRVTTLPFYMPEERFYSGFSSSLLSLVFRVGPLLEFVCEEVNEVGLNATPECYQR